MNATIFCNSLSESVLWTVRRFNAFTEICDSSLITDREVREWLGVVNQCLVQVKSSSPTSFGPDLSNIDNLRGLWRAAAHWLILKAPWLGAAELRQLQDFVGVCPEFVCRGRYRFTYDCFSSRIKCWTEVLAMIAGIPNVRFLEIGSFEGHSACWLLDNILTAPTASIVCIDLFPPSFERMFDRNIDASGSSAKVTKLKGRSEDVLRSLSGERFDAIYIDGSHEPGDVLDDATLSWPLLRSNGLLIFDDYRMVEDPLATLIQGPSERPEIGIDAFLSLQEGSFTTVHSGYQMIVRKI
jgi:hypothetical protein